MVFIKYLLFSFIILLSGCAKIEYLWDQGRGQLKILTKAKNNREVLKSVTIKESDKRKLKLIEKYKQYFYEYWKEKPADIYNKTYFLEQKAVTYLVIASPFNEIKARQECFWFMGCFPYLGFFSEEKAHDFSRELNRSNYITYVRPVYAYSSLGYFSDPVLSSFFYYSDRDLAELIFHELFHTIFFVKDDVDLNENMANYFAKEMVKEYFSDSIEEKKRLEMLSLKKQLLRKSVVDLVHELNRRYLKLKSSDQKENQELFDHFMANDFYPQIEKLCRDNKIDQCFPLKRKWNNASFVAYLTYEKSNDLLKRLREQRKLNLVELFELIKNLYQEYKESDLKKFEDLLKKRIK